MGRISRDKALLKRFGQKLAEARKRRKLTQEKLALRASVDRVYVNRLEAGVKNPTWLVAHDLARALGISIRDLA